MLHIAPEDLPTGSANWLVTWTNDLLDPNKYPTYADRVAAAKSKWSSRRSSTKTMADVVDKLAEACAGPRRCMYCEDSLADEVEHVRPKNLYPEVCFTWTNYLLSCGPCNGPKSDHFAVFDANGAVVEVSRPQGADVVPPLAGTEVFLDPRSEDPLDLLELDLEDTFFFVPVHDEGTGEHERAKYTIDTLHLNDRDYLAKSRKLAFIGYKSLLRSYISDRDDGASTDDLDEIKWAIQENDHPTVWVEMIRQRDHLPELYDLFQQAPEALAW